MITEALAFLTFIILSGAIGYGLMEWWMRTKDYFLMAVCCFLAGSTILVLVINGLSAIVRGVTYLLKFV